MLIACLRLKASSLAFWGAFPSCYHSILSFFSLLFRVGFVLYFFRDLLLRPRVTFRRQRLLSSLLAARWYALVLWSLVTRKTPRTKFVGKKGLDPKTRGTRFSPLRPRQKTTTTTTKLGRRSAFPTFSTLHSDLAPTGQGKRGWFVGGVNAIVHLI